LPSPALAPFVCRYWTFELAHPPATVNVIPDGLVDVVFALDENLAWVNGARDTPTAYTHERPTHLFGISLLPGSAPLILGAPAAALATEWSPLADAIGAVASVLVERVAAASTLEARVAVVEAFLLARVASAAVDGRVAAIRSIVDEEGDVSIPALGAAAGASPRNLGRLFDEWVGLGPKRFARVVRAQAALRRLADDPEADLAALAAELGFSDQAHLTRELRALTGLTPTEILRRL
jgi:AraC-like DNA-binding protein